jgi:hypothetical protein
MFDSVYCSAVVFISLGFGGIQPYQAMRLIAGVEGRVGLLRFVWSASFTDLMMEKLWRKHPLAARPGRVRPTGMRAPLVVGEEIGDDEWRRVFREGSGESMARIIDLLAARARNRAAPLGA